MAKKPMDQPPDGEAPKAKRPAPAKKAPAKSKLSLSDVTADDLIWNDPEAEIVKGNQYESDSWLHSPAMVELLANSYKRLRKLAGPGVTTVDRVRIALIKGTQLVVIKPTHAADPDGIEVQPYRSSARINAITVLGPQKMTVTAGYRERLPVVTTPEGFPIGPALVIDAGRCLERCRKGKKKRSDKQTPDT